jgi:very-short-patch-repair endonuclease/type I restriction-modification system DNA methylase subunit
MIDLNKYLAELQAHLTTGEAREHTYRPALISLFESFNDIQAANDQARTAHGATDFVYRSKSNLDIVLGYGEAKDINVSLDKTEKTEQLDRYSGYNNLLLTNGIEFRFYKNGKRYSQVEVAKLKDLSLTAIPENFQSLIDEIQSFFEQPPEVIKSGKRLSEIMGAKARRIRTNINILLDANSKDETRAAEISKVYQLMKNLLVHDLEPDKFADMYAQTLVYGLFVARYNDKTPDSFSRVEARDLIPASNPFLREFFDHIAGPRFEKGLSIIVDELCQVFSVSDVKDIIDKHLKLNESDQADAKDPIIHFYEDFLSEYNPVERKKMGAYYTPIPVVQYMVRAVDEVLKTHFNLPKGLADSSTETYDVISQGKKAKQTYHKVQILDPATGTATFLNETIKFVADKFKGQEGMWPDYAKNNLIPRLHGFELMMGAYTIAHLKLGLTLKNLGVDDIGKRLGVYLTNSLEEGIPHQPDLFSFGLAEAVTHESAEAAHIKSERPIMVVIGNPPYSGVSSNNFEHANRMIDKYKVEPGGKQKLQERNPKWLNDDYVKFIALSEDLINKNGEGVLAFITNHGYLDNPTFRGMRWHLAQTFDEIKIIDLHGNSKKKEVSPDGSKDENVFDIQQGVAIIIATKLKGTKQKDANVSVADIYGLRKFKFNKLNSDKIKFSKIALDKKQSYFANKNTEGKAEYEQGFSVAELFIKNSVGIVTAADGILIAESERTLLKQLQDAKNSSSTQKTQSKLREHAIEEDNIQDISYRPFDTRKLYYSTEVVERSRFDVMKHFLTGDNIGLVFERKPHFKEQPSTVFTVKNIMDVHISGGQISSGPLWLYDEQGNKTSNLNADIVQAIKLKAPDCDEQGIFDYIYGILHWTAYRTKYKEFLKIDFPRVPYPANQAEFNKFRAVGEKLRGLHLMTDPSVNDFITTFPVAGTNEVAKLKYEPNSPLEGCPEGGVEINKNTKHSPLEERSEQNRVEINKTPIKLQPSKSLPQNSGLKDLARQNRKAGVLSEVLFWQQVHKGKFHDLDFDRQKIIGNYIVDFFIEDLSLVIEIDGSTHNDKGYYDDARQEYLESLGLRVFRVQDGDVKSNLDSVLQHLEQFIVESYGDEVGSATPPSGHPSRGESAQAGLGRVYINETQYFGDVPEVAWNFYIGGYQPAQKWLKDRKGRTLSFEDIEHYQKIIKVLSETSRVMEGM